jgi:hypothetical protein
MAAAANNMVRNNGNRLSRGDARLGLAVGLARAWESCNKALVFNAAS